MKYLKTAYLYRLCGGWHQEIEANLAKLGVAYDWAQAGSHWKWYRVSLEETKKLPNDDGPYLPINDECGGYGLYTDNPDVDPGNLTWIAG